MTLQAVVFQAVGEFAVASIIYTVWPMADRILGALQRRPQSQFTQHPRLPRARIVRPAVFATQTVTSAGQQTPRSHAPRDSLFPSPAPSRPAPGQQVFR